MKFINFGLEAIAFQSPEFANKMIDLVDKIMEERTGKTADACKSAKDLKKLISDSTGMNIDITFDTEYPPCVIPYHINPDSILGHSSLKEYYAEEAGATMKRLKEVKQTSFIDLKNAKVGGIFSTYVIPIYMNFSDIRFFRLTPAEIVAVLSHEIGHAFVAYEMAFRAARTNQVLAAVAKAHAGGDKDEYKYVLKTTEELFGFKTGVLDQLVDVKKADVVLTVTLGEIEKNTYEQSIMGNTTYDITTFEAMSDNFAARLGLGRELVTGLEKIYKVMNAAEFSRTTRIIYTIIDIINLTSLIALFTMTVMAGSVFHAFFLVMACLALYSRLDGRDNNNIYDKLDIRFKRIKEQSVQYLKNKRLPPKEVKKAVETIAHIEKIIGEVSNYKGFLPVIFNLIDPASRAVNSAINVQKKLETLAANELYVKAAQLRTLD